MRQGRRLLQSCQQSAFLEEASPELRDGPALPQSFLTSPCSQAKGSVPRTGHRSWSIAQGQVPKNHLLCAIHWELHLKKTFMKAGKSTPTPLAHEKLWMQSSRWRIQPATVSRKKSIWEQRLKRVSVLLAHERRQPCYQYAVQSPKYLSP